MNHVFIIAEIGINHNGSVDIAKQLISMAKECGCDAVKFQKRDVSVCIPAWKRNEIKETPWGRITYFEYKKKLEFGQEEFDIIDDYCKSLGIDWFASAWDINSLNFLKKYDLKYNKVASAMLTNIPLVTEIAKEGKFTFISTGMSSLDDIEKAVSIFRRFDCPFALMHCVGSYPAKDNDLNLKMISVLKQRFRCPVGYSDHSRGVLAPALAVVLGACAIEKHITLDRTMFGTDQANSLEKRGLEIMVRDVRLVHSMLGDGIKRMLKEEELKLKDLRYWD
ncbi:MAG: N-acetylneuraminate synthase family protein [Candidatus Njordarchaeia archaeon]